MPISKQQFNNSFSIYFPELDNDGTDLTPIQKQIEDYLLAQFSGFTETKANGYWKTPSKMFCDNINILTVSTNLSSPHFYVGELLKICFDKTDQLSIFYIINGISYLAKR